MCTLTSSSSSGIFISMIGSAFQRKIPSPSMLMLCAVGRSVGRLCGKVIMIWQINRLCWDSHCQCTEQAIDQIGRSMAMAKCWMKKYSLVWAVRLNKRQRHDNNGDVDDGDGDIEGDEDTTATMNKPKPHMHRATDRTDHCAGISQSQCACASPPKLLCTDRLDFPLQYFSFRNIHVHFPHLSNGIVCVEDFSFLVAHSIQLCVLSYLRSRIIECRRPSPIRTAPQSRHHPPKNHFMYIGIDCISASLTWYFPHCGHEYLPHVVGVCVSVCVRYFCR